MWEQFTGADRTSVVDKPAIAVAHRVVLLDDGDDAALGQRQVELLCWCHFLRDDAELRRGVRGLHVGPLSRALTALRNVITLPTGSQSNEATHTRTHLFNGPFSRTTPVGRYQKGKNQSGLY